ncbi:MAG: alpha/beta hydrolase [Kofleriaceae bacterium]
MTTAAAWRYVHAPSDATPLFYELRPSAASTDPLAERAPPTPVVLLDGIGCDGYIWRYLAPALANHTVVHGHYRGHGRSAPPVDPDRVDIADLADDIDGVIADAGLPPAVLIGHSMGVQVALEIYRRHPGRVAALVLVCGAPGSPLRTFTATASLEDVLPRIQGLLAKTPRMANWLSRSLFPTRLAYEVAARLEIQRDLVDPRDFMPYLVGMSQIDTRLFVSMLRAIGRHSAEDVLPTVKVPTMVVAGGRDGFTPPSRSREMAAAIPGAELLEVPEGSHTAPIERADLINDGILAFVARHAGGGAAPGAPDTDVVDDPTAPTASDDDRAASG